MLIAPPLLLADTCPSGTPVTATTDADACDAVISYSAPTAHDNCLLASFPTQPFPQISQQASGQTFSLGVTSVTWQATDKGGRASTCTFDVMVSDAQAPTITCPANIVAATGSGACTATVTFAAPQGTDNCPGATTTIAASTNHPSGSTFALGTTTVQYNVEDAEALTGSCTFEVLVEDKVAPSVVCPSNQVVTVASGVCDTVLAYAMATPSDNCAGGLTVLHSGGPASGATVGLGTHTISFTAQDGSSNSATCSFTIRVETPDLPSIGQFV